ncbi:MAG: pseudouridine synthase [Anaerolineales bacterium]|nr:pseudouridine synthase [Anaerolineales bacterium]
MGHPLLTLRMKQVSDGIRLQKVIAQAGVASRRKSDELIRDGRVTVNGIKATLGMRVTPGKVEIRVDGEIIQLQSGFLYILLNKPRGVLSSLRSQGGRATVSDLIQIDRRIFPVGRLDLESEGLILMTDDGELTNRLTHPRYRHEKEYRVLLNRKPDQAQVKSWRRGVVLEDGFRTRPAEVWVENTKEPWVHVILTEGHKRQIRETAKSLGLRVKRLVRIRFADLEIGNLKPGEWRELKREEVKLLYRLVNS